MMTRALILLLASMATVDASLGGEKAFYKTPQMTPNTMHRQNVCDRYDLFRNGTVELKDALEGLQLRAGVSAYEGAYFNYDPATGIDRNYPGLAAVILDELARRGKFTWRNSFGVTGDPAEANATWRELLLWSIDSYDVHIDWWAQNLERMNLGVTFLKEWYDSSIILISKEASQEAESEINFWNWLRPYTPGVWIMTGFTIFLCAVVHQVLEWFADDRKERTMWEWWQENVYMSTMNATQCYEYQPKTLASRIFGIGMASWALVMTATYTANLASLLVDRKSPPPVPENLYEVAVFGDKICTWEGTYQDDHIRTVYPEVDRIPKQTIKEIYQSLQDGECKFAAESVASWNKHKAMKEYNQFCDLYWVGDDRKAHEVGAGFVSKADSGGLCTGFIRDVMNFHMQSMIEDGFLDMAWEKDYKRTQSINCDTYRPELAAAMEGKAHGSHGPQESPGTRRYLVGTNQNPPGKHRQLKGGSAAAAGAAGGAAAAGGGEAGKLGLDQMIGTFAFLYVLMIIALANACFNAMYNKHGKKHALKAAAYTRDSIVNLKDSLMGNSTRHSLTSSSRDDSFHRKGSPGNSGSSSSNSATRAAAIVAREMEEVSNRMDSALLGSSKGIIQRQLGDLRRSQVQVRQTLSNLEQAQLEMLIEQRQLQAQIQVLLDAHGPAILDPLKAQSNARSATAILDPPKAKKPTRIAPASPATFSDLSVSWRDGYPDFGGKTSPYPGVELGEKRASPLPNLVPYNASELKEDFA